MADAFGLSDVSTPDTGKGSELKTGGRRTHNMPGKACNKYSGAKKKRCLEYKGEFAKYKTGPSLKQLGAGKGKDPFKGKSKKVDWKKYKSRIKKDFK